MSSDFSMKVDTSRLMPAETPAKKTEISKTGMGHTFTIGNEVGGHVASLGVSTLSKTAHENGVIQRFQPGPQDKAISGAVSTLSAASFLVGNTSSQSSSKTDKVSAERSSSASQSEQVEYGGKVIGFLERQKAKLEAYLNRDDISQENRSIAQKQLENLKKKFGEVHVLFSGIPSDSQGIQAAAPKPGGPPIIHLIKRF